MKDVATLTGLPASTLRYYESVGVIAPIIPRGDQQAQDLRREQPGPVVGNRVPGGHRDVGARHEGIRRRRTTRGRSRPLTDRVADRA
ncbi:MerR family DNA-binding transcriptional regulator [Rhodococcus sp. T2V]|nr:MerR family DNA-binding transcriptional regulator [Rhodococcus sp. T2V]